MIFEGAINATNQVWQLTMSSKNSSFQNTFDSLNDNTLLTGAATNSEPNAFIQASFSEHVLVTNLNLALINNWPSESLNDCYLQYSFDNINWNHLSVIQEVKPTLTKVDLPQPIIARYWRLFRTTSTYIATAIMTFNASSGGFGAPSAKSKRYTVVMSSRYKTISPTYYATEDTYESLVDNNSKTGAATQSTTNSFIQATFDTPTLIEYVTLGSSWDPTYVNDRELQYSLDNSNWTTALKISNVGTSPTRLKLSNPITAKHWRIFISSGYVAIGTLIFE